MFKLASFALAVLDLTGLFEWNFCTVGEKSVHQPICSFTIFNFFFSIRLIQKYCWFSELETASRCDIVPDKKKL